MKRSAWRSARAGLLFGLCSVVSVLSPGAVLLAAEAPLAGANSDELAGVPPALAESLRAARAETVQRVLDAKTPVERSTAWGRLAMLYHAQRLRELARRTYDAALREAGLTEWRYLRGIARSELGDIEGSIRDFEVVTELDRKDTTAWYRLGLARWLSGDVGASRVALERALVLDPDAAVVMTTLAEVLRAQGDADGAIEMLERAWEIEPTAGQVAFKLAALAREQGDMEAVELWLARDPGNRLAPKIDDKRLLEVAHLSQSSRVFEVAADWALARGDADQAITSLRNAVAFAPEHLGLGLRLVTELNNAGKAAEAVRAAHKLTERRPDAARAWYVLAYLLRSSAPGEARIALAHCRELEDAPEAQNLAAAFAMADQQYKAARELYAALLEQSSDARVAYWLGIASLGAGDCTGVAALQRALAMQPGWGQAHIVLARAEALCGAPGRALQRAAAILKARDDVDTRITLAFAQLAAGDAAAASEAATGQLPHSDAAMLLRSIKAGEFSRLRPFAPDSSWWTPPLLSSGSGTSAGDAQP